MFSVEPPMQWPLVPHARPGSAQAGAHLLHVPASPGGPGQLTAQPAAPGVPASSTMSGGGGAGSMD